MFFSFSYLSHALFQSARPYGDSFVLVSPLHRHLGSEASSLGSPRSLKSHDLLTDPAPTGSLSSPFFRVFFVSVIARARDGDTLVEMSPLPPPLVRQPTTEEILHSLCLAFESFTRMGTCRVVLAPFSPSLPLPQAI